MTLPTGWDGPRYFATRLAPEQVRTNWTAPAAEPGIVPPRPLQFGDILGGAFRAVRFAPMTMFGLTLVILMVAQLLGLGAGYVLGRQFGQDLLPVDDPSTTLLSWSTVTGAMVTSVTGIVVSIALVFTVVEAVSGRKVTPSEALRRLLSRAGAVLGLTLLTSLAVAGVAALAFVPLAPLLAGEDAGLGVIAVILLVLVGGAAAVWLGTRLLLAPCVIAVEGVGPFRAIRRSWTLSRGLFWRLFGSYVLSSVIIGMAASTVSTVFSFAALLVGLTNPGLMLLAVTTASTLSSTVLSLPLTGAVLALLYVDARIRKEGYDLALSEELYG